MGKKEKFIDKASSQKFHLLHRSQRDEAHANFEVPSNFVLVPAVDNGNNNSNNNGGGGRYEPSKAKLSVRKDHINELGFANDGYDYSQHLKEIGNGGTFISKTGQAGTPLDLAVLSRREGAMVELPEECMPSAKNLDRHYEAITINHNLMDRDIRAALFEGFDDEGEFEELQDDFVMQVMNEPADDDFDFDAHIAKLIARSEQTLGLENKKKPAKVRFHGEDSDGEGNEFDSDDEFPDYLLDENDPDAMRKMGFEGYARVQDDWDVPGGDVKYLPGGDKASAVSALSAEAREALELQFEKTMLEYDDEEIGYLDDLEEEDIGGTIDLAEDEGALNSVLDEYLQQQKDNLFVEGTKLRKGVRSSVKVPGSSPEGDADAAEEEAEAEPVDVTQALREQVELQEETEQVLLRMKREAVNKDTSIETCQEYLKEVRIEEEWDCESILSTYSTLDNHPTLIKDPNSKFRKYKNPHQRHMEAAEARSAAGGTLSSSASVASRSIASRSMLSKAQVGGAAGSTAGSSIYGTSAALTARGPAAGPGKIVLSGRLNLPEGFGPTPFEKRKELPQRSLDSSTLQVNTTPSANYAGTTGTKPTTKGSKAALHDIAEGSESEGDSSDGEEGEGSQAGSGEEGSSDERKHSRSIARKRRQETPEEKKARKEAVKEERRQKRTGKKELKNAFKAEGTRIIRSVGNEQSTDHVSVFKYT